jgi:hypothetical protein
MSQDFQTAVERARRLTGSVVWDGMSLRHQADAIYEELRLLDTERVANLDEDTEASGWAMLEPSRV